MIVHTRNPNTQKPHDLTKEESQKIFSAFCNGVEYPFGGGDYSKCNKDELNYYADILTEALNRHMPIEIPVDQNLLACTKCRRFIRRIGSYSLLGYQFCPYCGQRIILTKNGIPFDVTEKVELVFEQEED